MPKTVSVYDGPDGFYKVWTSGYPGKGIFSPYPGSRWFPDRKMWLVPTEVWKFYLRGYFDDRGWSIEDHISSYQEFPHHTPDWMLKHQAPAFRAAYGRPAWILGFNMGLGKTAVACELLANWWKPGQTIGVVCPALARQVWLEQLNKWWPDHPSCHAITSGKAAKSDAPIQITSYSLAHTLPQSDLLVFDEIHALMHAGSQRSQTCAQLRSSAAKVLGLTGTLASHDPRTVWHIINTLWPGRAGTFKKWQWRYCEFADNEWGYPVFVGPKNEEELKARLNAMGSFVMDAGGLPEPDLDAITDRPIEQAATELTPTLIMTHYRDTAKTVGDKLGWKVMNGSTPAEKRVERLQAAEQGAVATIDSVREAVDLSHFKRVLYLEPVDNLRTMIQSMGRFRRLNSTHRVEIRFLGDPDDQKFFYFSKKLEALNKLFKASKTTAGAEEATKIFQVVSDEEFDAMLDSIMESETAVEIGELT